MRSFQMSYPKTSHRNSNHARSLTQNQSPGCWMRNFQMSYPKMNLLNPNHAHSLTQNHSLDR
jgi:hypothetical protein